MLRSLHKTFLLSNLYSNMSWKQNRCFTIMWMSSLVHKWPERAKISYFIESITFCRRPWLKLHVHLFWVKPVKKSLRHQLFKILENLSFCISFMHHIWYLEIIIWVWEKMPNPQLCLWHFCYDSYKNYWIIALSYISYHWVNLCCGGVCKCASSWVPQ